MSRYDLTAVTSGDKTYFATGGGSFGGATTSPLGLPSSTEVTLQFLVKDRTSIHGITLSNGLLATTL